MRRYSFILFCVILAGCATVPKDLASKPANPIVQENTIILFTDSNTCTACSRLQKEIFTDSFFKQLTKSYRFVVIDRAIIENEPFFEAYAVNHVPFLVRAESNGTQVSYTIEPDATSDEIVHLLEDSNTVTKDASSDRVPTILATDLMLRAEVDASAHLSHDEIASAGDVYAQLATQPTLSSQQRQVALYRSAYFYSISGVVPKAQVISTLQAGIGEDPDTPMAKKNERSPCSDAKSMSRVEELVMMSKSTFAMLNQIAHGIACQFGSNCEVVVHDLSEDYTESSIVAIHNGHVTMRKIGDGPSHVVLEALQKTHDELEDHLNYLTKTKDGRILKSSTMFIRDHEGTIEAILSINFDITSMQMAESALSSFTHAGSKENEPEKIFQNVSDLLDELIEQSIKKVGKPVALMNKEDKILAIQFLNQTGAFLITKSGDKVSNYFGISKYTLYSYLEAGQNLEK